jgi:Major capsid protein N-terminus/Large eukaryotic DNA virus major capsid protein
MAGGLLNIISEGSANVMLTGNPSKTFFTVTYSKYTNFGLQKFRLDYEGSRDLRPTEESVFTFKMKRYADLLMDTYLVVTLPDIWSPIYHPCPENNYTWAPYEFRWIRNIGANMIKWIEISCGSQTLQRYSGEYLAAMVERDFNSDKKDLFNRMSGNTNYFYDPANTSNRANAYPSAFYSGAVAGEEPSIRGQTLYIPINTWFTLDSRCAFPLISLQYNELIITVTMRSTQELFQVRDVFDYTNLYPYVAPDYNLERMKLYRFLQTPPAANISQGAYVNTTMTWNADIHLMSTYCFLSNDESKLFAAKDQVYLVKDVFQYDFLNVTGSSRVKLNSNGMITNWMWYLRRNDVNLRNEWSNYTNWPYLSQPQDVVPAPSYLPEGQTNIKLSNGSTVTTGPIIQPVSGYNTGYYITGAYSSDNHKDILETMGILLDGDYRENVQTRGIFDYIEKYVRTNGSAKDGLYCYNFCLNTSPFEYQPSGAINLSRFKNIELEVTTYIPTIDSSGAYFNVICGTDGTPIGVSVKPSWMLYEYNYDMTLFEERYNILSFIGGNCGMLYAR